MVHCTDIAIHSYTSRYNSKIYARSHFVLESRRIKFHVFFFLIVPNQMEVNVKWIDNFFTLPNFDQIVKPLFQQPFNISIKLKRLTMANLFCFLNCRSIWRSRNPTIFNLMQNRHLQQYRHYEATEFNENKRLNDYQSSPFPVFSSAFWIPSHPLALSKTILFLVLAAFQTGNQDLIYHHIPSWPCYHPLQHCRGFLLK